MSDSISIPSMSLASSPAESLRSKRAEIQQAATQFESLLIQQMLKSARESGASLSGESDSTGETVRDMADQQFAQVIAANGGVGLATLVLSGLQENDGGGR